MDGVLYGSGAQPGRHGRDINGMARAPLINDFKPGMDTKGFISVAGTPAYHGCTRLKYNGCRGYCGWHH